MFLIDFIEWLGTYQGREVFSLIPRRLLLGSFLVVFFGSLYASGVLCCVFAFLMNFIVASKKEK